MAPEKNLTLVNSASSLNISVAPTQSHLPGYTRVSIQYQTNTNVHTNMEMCQSIEENTLIMFPPFS